MITFASLDNLDEIHALLKTASAEILPVPKPEIRTAIINGRCVWHDGVAIIYSRSNAMKYYGVVVGDSAVQIEYIVSRDKGTGAGKRVLRSFLDLMQGRNRTYLLVKTDNSNAIAFYVKFDFKIAKTIKFKTFNSFLMVRNA